MLSIKYISGGKQLDFAYNHTRYILDGFKVAHTVNNFTNKGYNQHGSTYIKSLMDELDITLSYLLHSENNEDIYQLEDSMMAAFYPDGLKTVVITTSAYTRALDCYITQLPTVVENYGKTRKYEVKMRAAVPFSRDAEWNFKTFSEAVGGLTFGLQFDYGTDGVQFGQEGRSSTVINTGVKPAPVIIEMSGTRMVNPVLTFTGVDSSYTAKIGVNYTINADEKITITTGYGEKDVILTRADGTTTSITRYLTNDSTWVELPVGESKVDSSIAEGNTSITLKWYNYYTI